MSRPLVAKRVDGDFGKCSMLLTEMLKSPALQLILPPSLICLSEEELKHTGYKSHSCTVLHGQEAVRRRETRCQGQRACVCHAQSPVRDSAQSAELMPFFFHFCERCSSNACTAATAAGAAPAGPAAAAAPASSPSPSGPRSFRSPRTRRPSPAPHYGGALVPTPTAATAASAAATPACLTA